MRRYLFCKVLFLLVFRVCELSGNQLEAQLEYSPIPEGKFCFFSCVQWIFHRTIVQVAPSASFVNAARLPDNLIGFANYRSPNQDICDFFDDNKSGNIPRMCYANIWGALYFANKSDREPLFRASESVHPQPYTFLVNVITSDHRRLRCLTTDFGILPGNYPLGRGLSAAIWGQGFTDMDYYNELLRIGVPQPYVDALRTLPPSGYGAASGAHGRVYETTRTETRTDVVTTKETTKTVIQQPLLQIDYQKPYSTPMVIPIPVSSPPNARLVVPPVPVAAPPAVRLVVPPVPVAAPPGVRLVVPPVNHDIREVTAPTYSAPPNRAPVTPSGTVTFHPTDLNPIPADQIAVSHVPVKGNVVIPTTELLPVRLPTPAGQITVSPIPVQHHGPTQIILLPSPSGHARASIKIIPKPIPKLVVVPYLKFGVVPLYSRIEPCFGARASFGGYPEKSPYVLYGYKPHIDIPNVQLPKTGGAAVVSPPPLDLHPTINVQLPQLMPARTPAIATVSPPSVNVQPSNPQIHLMIPKVPVTEDVPPTNPNLHLLVPTTPVTREVPPSTIAITPQVTVPRVQIVLQNVVHTYFTYTVYKMSVHKTTYSYTVRIGDNSIFGLSAIGVLDAKGHPIRVLPTYRPIRPHYSPPSVGFITSHLSPWPYLGGEVCLGPKAYGFTSNGQLVPTTYGLNVNGNANLGISGKVSGGSGNVNVRLPGVVVVPPVVPVGGTVNGNANINIGPPRVVVPVGGNINGNVNVGPPKVVVPVVVPATFNGNVGIPVVTTVVPHPPDVGSVPNGQVNISVNGGANVNAGGHIGGGVSGAVSGNVGAAGSSGAGHANNVPRDSGIVHAYMPGYVLAGLYGPYASLVNPEAKPSHESIETTPGPGFLAGFTFGEACTLFP